MNKGLETLNRFPAPDGEDPEWVFAAPPFQCYFVARVSGDFSRFGRLPLPSP
jgi:hypothetical protein